MKCFYHNDMDATCQCNDCGKYLCTQCGSIYNPPLCHDCAAGRNIEQKQEAIKTIILGIVFFVGAFIFCNLISKDNPMPLDVHIEFAIVFACVPWGWRALNKLTSDMFIGMSVIWWLIYFIIKLAISLFIGFFVMIYQIGKIIYLLVKSKSMDKYISDNKNHIN